MCKKGDKQSGSFKILISRNINRIKAYSDIARLTEDPKFV